MRTKPLPSAKFTLGLALSVLSASVSNAATATTEPVGHTAVSLLANSDTYVSVPFQRPAVFVGQIASFSGNVITLAGSPGWSSNQLIYATGSQPNTYYAFVRSGTKEGNYYTVTANSGNSLTLDLGGDTLAGLTSSDSISVIPYWTLSTVFPASDLGVSFAASASVVSRQTQVLIPDLSSAGTNLAPSITYFYYNNAWRRFGQSLTLSRNDDILQPDAYFIVRNQAFTGALTHSGGVLVKKLVTPLATRIGGKQDNPVALLRPIPVSLNDSGLISSGAFTASTSAVIRSDELLVFDNTTTGTNKSASATYFFFNGAWRKFGSSLTLDFGPTLVFGPTTAIQIRKASSSTGYSSTWVNSPTY